LKIDKKEFKPVCLFCESELDYLVEVKGGWFEDKRVYCCPKCKKIVGINFRLP
jgi:transposase-like protein